MTFSNSSLTLQIEKSSLLNGTTLDYELRMAALAILDKLKIPQELEPFLAYAKAYWANNTSLNSETSEEFDQVFEDFRSIRFTDPVTRRIADVLGFVLSYSELSDSEVLSDGVDWLAIYVEGFGSKGVSLLDLAPKDS
jgi:hypothetical protein